MSLCSSARRPLRPCAQDDDSLYNYKDLKFVGFELWQASAGRGSGLWLALAAGMLGYAVYTFFITWPGDGSGDDERPSA